MSENIDNDSLRAKVLAMYKEGFSCKDISLFCKLPVLNVRHFLQEAGYNTRTYRRASEANKEKVLLLIKAGYSYSQIERLLHVSTHLIREIVLNNRLVGFAPRYHHPIVLDVDLDPVSMGLVQALREAYLTGDSGLTKCAERLSVPDDAFLWFVYHLTDEDKKIHCDRIRANIQRLRSDGVPVTAIAKILDVSPSIVKKMI